MIVFADSSGRAPIEILASQGRVCRVRGGMLLAHLAWAEQHHGIEEIWPRLPGPFRQTLPSSITSEDWLSFAFLIAVDKAIAEVFGVLPEESDYIELGRFSARRNFRAGLDLTKA